MQFADYVLENYIAVDSKFPPILWAKPPDLLFPYTNNGAESYHSHMNAEFYVKHPNIYVFVDVLKKDSTRMWANAQPDGRPVEHRWRPLFNAAKFG